MSTEDQNFVEKLQERSAILAAIFMELRGEAVKLNAGLLTLKVKHAAFQGQDLTADVSAVNGELRLRLRPKAPAKRTRKASQSRRQGTATKGRHHGA